MRQGLKKGMAYVMAPADTGAKTGNENLTLSDKKELLEESMTLEQKDQEKTRIKKDIFLVHYRTTLGSVAATCEMTDISRETYYNWLKKDPIFNQKIRASFADKLNDVEQQLNKAVLKGDVGAIRYFLDRRHPLYMPKLKVVAPKAGERSMEDLIIEGEWSDSNEIYDETKETEINIGDDNTEVLLDQGQERKDGAVQVEPGAVVLLEKKNEEKPDTKIQTGGNK